VNLLSIGPRNLRIVVPLLSDGCLNDPIELVLQVITQISHAGVRHPSDAVWGRQNRRTKLLNCRQRGHVVKTDLIADTTVSIHVSGLRSIDSMSDKHLNAVFNALLGQSNCIRPSIVSRRLQLNGVITD
jgi:hypothetical protein